jgi:hypothetical protein
MAIHAWGQPRVDAWLMTKRFMVALGGHGECIPTPTSQYQHRGSVERSCAPRPCRPLRSYGAGNHWETNARLAR